jgi:outer membrane lipoprotein-sorting protein
MRRRTAWLFLSLSLALCLFAGLALAQEGTTTVVPKTPSATGAVAPQVVQPPARGQPAPVEIPGSATTEPKDQLRPAQDLQDEAAPAAAPTNAPANAATEPGEMNGDAGDEGAGWDAAVEAAPGPTPLIGEEQAAAVQRINDYFNGITNLQGSFEQVDSNDKQTTGRFYVQRPGKLRFDYAPPSALKIVADGHFLAIEDGDLKTVEKYPLEATPFRLLLADAVDLGRDARIVGVESQEGTLAIALQDKSGDAAGQIKLYFDTGSELKLKQWVITDAQGLATKVTINDIVPGRKVATDFFTSIDEFQPFR